MSVPPSHDPELLLAHAGFIRAVARGLVSEPYGADDVEQETWVAAMGRRTPLGDRDRPWLVAVARNAARMRWRSDRRRRKRERVSLRDVGVPSPSQILEREEARRAVVRAVFELPANYRDAVKLRYLEGLRVREVAARLGLPLETVRTRLRRARERLRASLVEQDPKRDWRAVLLPLAAGGMAVKSKLVPVIAIVALLAGGAVVALLGPWSSSVNDSVASHPVDAEAGKGPTLAMNPKKRGDELASVKAPADPRFERAGRGRGRMYGVVVDTWEAPVAGATVRLSMAAGSAPPFLGSNEPGAAVAVVTTEADGRFDFGDLAIGAYRVHAFKEGHGDASQVAAAAADPGFTHLQLRDQQRERTLHVHVVDADGRDVSDVRLTLWRMNHHGEPLRVTADASGRASLRYRGPRMVLLRAEGSRGVVQTTAPPHNTPVSRSREASMQVVLEKPGALQGRVRLPEGVNASADVEAWMTTGHPSSWVAAVAVSALVDEKGIYRFDALAAGDYTLRVRAGSLRVDRGVPREPTWQRSFPFELASVTVETGQTTTHDLNLVAGGTMRGVVRLVDGRPVVGAKVETYIPTGRTVRCALHGLPVWRLDHPGEHAGRHPFAYWSTRTGADGRWDLPGLIPSGLYRVRVVPEGDLSFAYQGDVRVVDGEAAEFEHVLRPAGTLEVVTRLGAYWGIREIGAKSFTAIWIRPGGPAPTSRIPHIAAGSYEIMTGVSGQLGRTPVRMGTFEIRAGETTYYDMRSDVTQRVDIRVLRANLPVEGAWVKAFGLATRRTDADGRASFATHWPYEYELLLNVRAPENGAVSVHVRFANAVSGEYVVNLPSRALQAQFVDESGRGIAGARFMLDSVPSPMSSQGRRRGHPKPKSPLYGVLRHADQAGHAQWVGIPADMYDVKAEDLVTGVRAVLHEVIVENDTKTVVLRGYAPYSVRVRVIDENGDPVVGATVGVNAVAGATEVVPSGDPRWKKPLSFWNLTGRTDKFGRLTLKGLPAGCVHVGAFKGEDRSKRSGGNTPPMMIGPGERNEVEVTLKPPRPEPRAIFGPR